MDPTFIPIELPSYLETVRKALVGKSTEWWTLTLRVESILAIMRSDRYAEYYEWPDSRVTNMAVEPFYTDFTETLTTLTTEATTADATVIYIPSDKAVEVYRSWDLSLTTPGSLLVTDTNGSKQMPLDPYGKISGDLQLATDFVLGAQWKLVSKTQPVNWPTTVFTNMALIPDTALVQLFSPSGPDEADVLATFKRWWSKGVYSQERLAAIALAYVRKATALL